MENPTRFRHYLLALLVCASVTLLTSGLKGFFDPANVVMLYLAGVLFVTVKLGRWPGVLASFVSVAAFDFFFVTPHLSFTVHDTQYLLTFVVMLALALAASNLMASLGHQARMARFREQRAFALYALTKDLASGLTTHGIIQIATSHMRGLFPGGMVFFLPDTEGRVCMEAETLQIKSMSGVESALAQWVYEQQEAAGLGTKKCPANPILYLPLKAPLRTRGVLALLPEDAREIVQPEQYQLLQTCASQVALALERVHFVEVAQDALVRMESERMRNSILSAISHDLRTPLTVIVGLANTIYANKKISGKERDDLAMGIHDEALRMISLIVNLLDMARLQAGGLRLNKQWQPIEEVIGTSLRATRRVLVAHHVSTRVPLDLPLISFDAVLVERVLCNLLENAAKYTRAGSSVVVSVEHAGAMLCVSVSDNGPGLPKGIEQRIFDMFARGERESGTPGVGLGLAICKAIMTAHGGDINAENNNAENNIGGGACFTVSFPVGEPPFMPETVDIH